MKYFIRNDGNTSQIDEKSNPSYFKYALENYKEITEKEYESLCLEEEPKEDYTDLSYLYDEPVKSPTSNVEPKVEEVIEEEPKTSSLPY